MAGHAAAHALIADHPALSPQRFDVSLATADDDAEVRRLLRERPLAGDVTVSLEREPDSCIAAAIEGDVHQLLVARERTTNRLAAIGSRTVRDAFLNGHPARVGYLGQLRVAESFRGSRALLNTGFEFCRTLHESGDAHLYLTSILADNHAARRLLVGFRSAYAPRFTECGSLATLVLSLRGSNRKSASTTDVAIRPASVDLLDRIAECLQRHGRRYQFAPRWTEQDLCRGPRTPDLLPEHFTVAVRHGRIVGCIARWDQRRFKQVVVRGYSTRFVRWKPLVDAAAKCFGTPRLPEPGARLEFAYLSHFAVDDDDPAVATALVAAACAGAPPDLDYVVTALAENNPLLPELKRRFRHREYRSVLYAAHWSDGAHHVRDLDQRPPHPEVAIL